MKSFNSFHTKNHRFVCGYTFNRLAFGVGIDRFSFTFDFAFFWFAIEW